MNNFFKKIFGLQNVPEVVNNKTESHQPLEINNLTENVNQSQSDKPTMQELTIQEIEFYINNEVNSRLNDFSPNRIREYANYKLQNSLGRIKSENVDLNNRDILFEDAARLIVLTQQGSASFLQRKLKLGYNRAGRLIDQLETAGIIGSINGISNRQVLIKDIISLNSILNLDNNKFLIDEKESLFYTKYYNSYENEIISMVKTEIEKRKILKEENEKEILKKELLEKERKKRLAREAKKELLDEGLISNQSLKKREHIPQDVKDMVWNRDEGKCVQCGSNEKLEFDHIIPFIKGGSNTYRNLQLLCEKCNREKSAKIG